MCKTEILFIEFSVTAFTKYYKKLNCSDTHFAENTFRRTLLFVLHLYPDQEHSMVKIFERACICTTHLTMLQIDREYNIDNLII